MLRGDSLGKLLYLSQLHKKSDTIMAILVDTCLEHELPGDVVDYITSISIKINHNQSLGDDEVALVESLYNIIIAEAI